MARSYTTSDLVQLPRVDAREAIALACLIEATTASDEDLPEDVAEVVAQVAGDRAALEAIVGPGPFTAALSVKEADRQVDIAGRALYEILHGWSLLAEFISEGKVADEVLGRVFAGGLFFVNLRVEKEWAEIESKLKTIDGEHLEPKIASLGAQPALAFLRKAHVLYGAAIGTTESEPEPPEVREARDTLLESLREYIIKVAALEKRNRPETKARVQKLLRPIADWEARKQAARRSSVLPPSSRSGMLKRPSGY